MTYLIRSTLIPTDDLVKYILRICKKCKFTKSIVCHALELSDRILNALIESTFENFRFITRRSYPLSTDYSNINLFPHYQSNLKWRYNEWENVFNIYLFRKFLSKLNNADLQMDIESMSQSNIVQISIAMIAIVCVSLSFKLHKCDRENGNRLRKYQKINFKQFAKTHSTSNQNQKQYPLIEQHILNLIQFNLHIDSLDNHIDVLLELMKPCFDRISNFQFKCKQLFRLINDLIVVYHYKRSSVLKQNIERIYQHKFGLSWYDENRLELDYNDHLFISSSIIEAAFFTQYEQFTIYDCFAVLKRLSVITNIPDWKIWSLGLVLSKEKTFCDMDKTPYKNYIPL